MALKDRIADLEQQHGTGGDDFARGCEEIARMYCRSAVEYVEKSIEYRQYHVKGLFTKVKYVEGYFPVIHIIKGWHGVTPQLCESEYIVAGAQEAKTLISCVVSELEQEGFKCKTERYGNRWRITHTLEWK